MITTATTELDVYTFKYIISKVEDLITMIDGKVSISAESTNGDDSFKGIRLSFPLKNGYAEIILGKSLSTMNYYNHTDKLLAEAKFNTTGDIARNFDMALREIIAADKRNKPVDNLVTEN